MIFGDQSVVCGMVFVTKSSTRWKVDYGLPRPTLDWRPVLEIDDLLMLLLLRLVKDEAGMNA